VFVKAEIIRPPRWRTAGFTDLEKLSAREPEAFEKHEPEFQTTRIGRSPNR
jgi:hypothetical protein